MDTVFYLSITLLVLAVVVIAARAIGVYGQRASYASYWRAHNEQEPEKGAIRVLVLGDSIMQGIGASSPDKGLGGLIAEHITIRTQRPVALTNLSVTGAKVHDLLTKQLPQADFAAADIIAISISANDSFRRTPIEAFTADIDSLMRLLPKDKTVIADVPGVGQRNVYQPVLHTSAQKHKIRRADLATAFSKAGTGIGVTAGDFFHPNDRGYEIWFSAFAPEIDDLLDRLKTETK